MRKGRTNLGLSFDCPISMEVWTREREGKEEKKGRKEGKKGREEKVILEGGTYCRGCAGRKKGSRKKGRGKGRKKGEGEKKTAPRQAAPGGARQTGRRDGGRDGKSEIGAFAVPPSISPACLDLIGPAPFPKVRTIRSVGNMVQRARKQEKNSAFESPAPGVQDILSE